MADLGWVVISDPVPPGAARWKRLVTSSLTGFGYGFGAKYSLPNHWFVMGEIQKVDYRSKQIGPVDVKPSSTVVALGLGYHF